MSNEYAEFKNGIYIVSERGGDSPGLGNSIKGCFGHGPLIIDSFYKTDEGLYHNQHCMGQRDSTGTSDLMLAKAMGYFPGEFPDASYRKLESTQISSESSSLLKLLKKDNGENRFKKGDTLIAIDKESKVKVTGKILKSKKVKNGSFQLDTN